MSDSEDNDVPEIGLQPTHIQPYQFEPIAASNVVHRQIYSESDSDESDGDQQLEQAQSQDSRMDNDAWCDCGSCHSMATDAECLCCQEVDLITIKTEERHIQCITQHDGFIANCLNRDVLEVSVFEFVHHEGPVGDNDPAHKFYRHITYRRFTRWIWHCLGKRRRKVLPACVVTAIRERFPSQEYCGFRYVIP